MFTGRNNTHTVELWEFLFVELIPMLKLFCMPFASLKTLRRVHQAGFTNYSCFPIPCCNFKSLILQTIRWLNNCLEFLKRIHYIRLSIIRCMQYGRNLEIHQLSCGLQLEPICSNASIVAVLFQTHDSD